MTWITDGDALTGNYTTGPVKYGQTIKAPATPLKTGYSFRDWGAAIGVMPARNLTYTASWIINKYTYVFYDEGGVNEIKRATVDYGSEIIAPANPTKAPTVQYAYTFCGWNKTVPGTITQNISFIATYTNAIRRYTVTFEDTGESTVPDFVGDYNTKAERPSDPTKADTRFLGWYIDEQRYFLYCCPL